MELSRTHTPSKPAPTVVAVKVAAPHVVTANEQAANEQCGKVSNPIPDCVAVLTDMMAHPTQPDKAVNHKTARQEAEEFAASVRIVASGMSIREMGRWSYTHPNGEFDFPND